MNTLLQLQKDNIHILSSIDIEENDNSCVKTNAPLKSNSEYIGTQSSKHDAEPIKDIKDVVKISSYLIRNGRYRDNMLFILGCNFGLRCSDLLNIHVYDVVDANGIIKDSFEIVEKKTKRTKGRTKCMIDLNAYTDYSTDELAKMLSDKMKANPAKVSVPKTRTIYINKAAKHAIKLYLDNTNVFLDDFLFRSQSNNGSNKNVPLSRRAVDMILKKIMSDLDIEVRAGTHLMRKTFGYTWMKQHSNDPQALEKLQKIFNHSSRSVTLSYIGITDEDIRSGLMDMNIGIF